MTIVKERSEDYKQNMNIGNSFNTNNSGVLVIESYAGNGKYGVRFLATDYCTVSALDKIKAGKVKDKLKPSVSNVGYIGDGKYSCKSHNEIYSRWRHMLARCYSVHYSGYEGCTVCERWHNFQNFAEDFYSLPGFKNDFKYLDLDKDTRIAGNKLYSPDTCCLIPHRVNFNYAVGRGI